MSVSAHMAIMISASPSGLREAGHEDRPGIPGFPGPR
jgi:hypothetical protein